MDINYQIPQLRESDGADYRVCQKINNSFLVVSDWMKDTDRRLTEAEEQIRLLWKEIEKIYQILAEHKRILDDHERRISALEAK